MAAPAWRARRLRPLDDLGAFLTGEWRIARVYLDHLVDRTGHLRGQATFVPVSYGLRYQEQGTLTFGAVSTEGRQTYHYALSGPGSASVSFADGRPFHTVDVSSGLAETRHICPPDLYRGRYRILDWDRWTLSWTVTGPRKALQIGTSFHRIVPSASAQVRDALSFATRST